jgi:hypothetical protein
MNGMCLRVSINGGETRQDDQKKGDKTMGEKMPLRFISVLNGLALILRLQL